MINPALSNENPRPIKILGVGSERDRMLFQTIEMASQELGISVDIQLVSDIKSFLKIGITAIPALMIDEKVLTNGRIPGVSEVKSLLQESI